MLLSARLLSDCQNANSFDYVDQLEFSAGDTVNCYFQLIDLTKERAEKGHSPAGRRYIPASGATVKVTFSNLDSSLQVTQRVATAPFAGDQSIWMVSILPTDSITGTVDMIVYLTEGVKVTTGRTVAALSVHESV